MHPRIEILTEKKLIGKRKRMSFAQNKTKELWQEFMPQLKTITNKVSSELYSVEVYNDTQFIRNFNPKKEFEKWAAVEVRDHNIIPIGMEMLTIPSGHYAVFIHMGKASEGDKTYQYIFNSWLPGSEYTLDNRPHFAVMGEKYKQDDESSEEEIWIPVKREKNLF